MSQKLISSSPVKKKFLRLNSIENYAPIVRSKSTQSIAIQTNRTEKLSKYTNTPNYLDEMLIQGKNMNDEDFEKFIKVLECGINMIITYVNVGRFVFSSPCEFVSEQIEKRLILVNIAERASDCYWKVLAERARMKLDEELRENRQLHELFNELTKENDHLQAKHEHCEYLTNVFNSITSEYDSGIELHITDESPVSKRQKTHI